MSFVYYKGNRLKKMKIGPHTSKQIGCDIFPGSKYENDRVSRIRKANRFERYFGLSMKIHCVEGKCDMVTTYNGVEFPHNLEDSESVTTQKTNSVLGLKVNFINTGDVECKFEYVCAGSVIFSCVHPSTFELGKGQKILDLGNEGSISDINQLGYKFSIACICLVKMYKNIPVKGSEVLDKLKNEGCELSNFVKDVVFVLQSCYPVTSVLVETLEKKKYLVSYVSDRGCFKIIVTSASKKVIVVSQDKSIETDKMEGVVSFVRTEFREHPMYYSTTLGDDKQVRSSMNAGKMSLINKYATATVKDVGVGIGGDLQFYDAAGVKGVVGIDYDKNSLSTASDRGADLSLRFSGVECDYRISKAEFSQSAFGSCFSFNSITQLRFKTHTECFVDVCKQGMKDDSALVIVYPVAERLMNLSSIGSPLVQNYVWSSKREGSDAKSYSVAINGKVIKEYVVDANQLHDVLTVEGYFFMESGTMADVVPGLRNLDLIHYLGCYTYVVYKLANFSNV